jgi:CheY-like chemotaxis protein/Tfp pilus assembly protein PilZ
LIVDDTAMFRDLCALFLARCGRVLAADGGAAGIEMAKNETPDVVLVDFHMPDVDGEAVCRAIRGDPDLAFTSIIVMLSDGDPEDRARAVRAGADDVLSKPLSRISIIDSVNRYLRAAVEEGLTRIHVSMPVQLHIDGKDFWGTGLNLSRGGIYVETDQSFSPQAEVDLQFVLPETDLTVRPSAEIVWRKVGDARRQRFGIGMRFLEIDGKTTRHLDDYIFERALTTNPPGLDSSL